MVFIARCASAEDNRVTIQPIQTAVVDIKEPSKQIEDNAKSIVIKENEVLLTQNNSVSLIGEVNYMSTRPIIDAIRKSDKNKPFYLYIYSPGGDVLTSLAILEQLKEFPHAVCIGQMAISMAFSILQACPSRYITELSILMQHQVQSSVSGSSSQIVKTGEVTGKLMILLHEQDAKRLKMSVQEFNQKTENEWWLFGAESILKENAADKVISIKCSEQLNKSGTCPIGKLQ